jgi:acetyl-CoA carboxylase biotin carboxyl carrier protein
MAKSAKSSAKRTPKPAATLPVAAKSAAPAASAAGVSLGSLQEIVALMVKNGLTEVNLEGNGQTIYLSRNTNPAPGAPVYAAAPAPVSAPAPVATPAPGAAPAPAASSAKADTINSQMVGTFYAASGPDAKPFVRPGDAVTADTVVCIVEAMKVFNEIKAGKAGTIAKVLVESGKPVEFGTPLFELK